VSETATPAQVHWDDDGQPLSSAYADVYFSRHDGLAESRHVFLNGNRLTERFNALCSGANHDTFTIAETGFGTGLNFLASWQLWREQTRGNNRLHFISVEKHPLTVQDLTRALALWPELADLASQLTAQYPAFIGLGLSRLYFSDNVSLTLIIDEAVAGFQSLLWPVTEPHRSRQPRVDAWFLDGFAPSKNPAMWSEPLFHSIASLSGPATTAATFSAAGVVKRGLLAAGFNIAKVPGFGRKREMITATNNTVITPPTSARALVDSYQQQACHSSDAQTALVIGAGLAGCHTARALAEAGWQVTVIEQNSPASGGSGNPQGLLYARLSHRRETLPLFNLQALLYAQQYYRHFWHNNPEAGARCGLLQLPSDEAQALMQQQVVAALNYPDNLVRLTDATEASRLSGIPLNRGGLYFPQCGWLDPRQVCAGLLDQPNITLLCGHKVGQLKQTDGHWQAVAHGTDRSIASAAVVVVACAELSTTLAQLAPLPLKPIRGQISSLSATTQSAKLNTALCAQGYLAPAYQGSHCLGATFNTKDQDVALSTQDHQRNLDHLTSLGLNVKQLFNNPTVKDINGGRAAFRCTTPDYLPVVGPVPDFAALKRDCAALKHNAKACGDTPPSYHKGLYVNGGHGSRGLAYTPVCGQLLADIINRQCAPVSAPLAQALHPARFALRDLIRGR